MQCTRRSHGNLTNHVIPEHLVLPTGRTKSSSFITAMVIKDHGHGRKVFTCRALRRGFESHLHEVAFEVILDSQNNTKYYVQNII